MARRGDAAAAEAGPAASNQARKWAVMDSEELGLRQKLESSVATFSEKERATMNARLAHLTEARERRNATYFNNEKAQDLGHLLTHLGLLQYMYLVCGAYGTMQRLRDDVQQKGADWVAKDLMELPMTEEHAWKLLGEGLGAQGGPGSGGVDGASGRGEGADGPAKKSQSR